MAESIHNQIFQNNTVMGVGASGSHIEAEAQVGLVAAIDIYNFEMRMSTGSRCILGRFKRIFCTSMCLLASVQGKVKLIYSHVANACLLCHLQKMQAGNLSSNPWISLIPVPMKLRLFCLPYSGGVAMNIYRR